MFQSITVVGAGLIGGSLLKAIDAYKLSEKICVIDPVQSDFPKTWQYFERPKKIISSELIILALPLLKYQYLLEKVQCDADFIIDIGSVKGGKINELLQKYGIYGFHPIAGSEKTGFAYASKDLFRNKTIYYTNLDTPNKLLELWKVFSGSVELIDPELHDKIYAYVSHLPQLLAFAFKDLCHENNVDYQIFADFSRLCASNLTMWDDIFRLNNSNIKEALSKFSLIYNEKQKENIVQAIADSLTLCCFAYKKYAGSGYKSMTSIVINRQVQMNNPQKIIQYATKMLDYYSI